MPVLPTPMRFAVAPLATLGGLLVQSAVLRHEGIAPFVFFFVSVAITSWVAGRAPGLLCVVLSALAANYFFIAPTGEWSVTPAALSATGLFLIAAAVVSFLCASFRQAALDLREADRRKNEFLGVLSHELRNPLAPIRNAVYLLSRSDITSDRARRARDVIERQADHMAARVDELLDVTRIARGKIDLHRQRTDVREVVRRTGEDHRALMELRGLELAIELPPEACFANADPIRLSQIVSNLLQNAAKFTGTDGRVDLAVVPAERGVQIRVRDTGIGIEPGLLDRIFEPFTQGEQALARTEGGLGLGLPLVKALAELHGGSAEALSAGPGRGAEFIVTIPCAPPEGAAPDGGNEAETPARTRTVLVVDDHVDAAESLAQLLQMLGHRVEVAFDGPSAIDKVHATLPDVVICDIGLPGMSGYDVARSLQDERRRGVRLVALSGHAMPEDVKAARDAGFDLHLAKPPDPQEIERLLR